MSLTPEKPQMNDRPSTATDPSTEQAPGDLSQMVDAVLRAQMHLLNTLERMLRRDVRSRNIRTALLGLSIIVGALLYFFGLQRVLAPASIAGPYAAVVRIEGLIDADQRTNALKVNAALRSAFEDAQAKGVVLLINSPGGSPVQASLIHDRILSLRAAHPDKSVWAIGEDQVTSGAYFIAVAAPHVCVNRSTMTGSIGVVMQGWGFDRAIDRYDIERRVFTAGDRKVRLDAFQPLRPQDQAKADELLQAIHSHFINAVTTGRGTRLRGEPKELFSGDYWAGGRAAQLGLVDGLCDLDSVMHEEFGVSQFRDYTLPPNVFTRLANSFGALIDARWTTQFDVPVARLLP